MLAGQREGPTKIVSATETTMSDDANAVTCRGCAGTGDCSSCGGKGYASFADNLLRNRYNNQEGIRIDAKRQALDALDVQRGRVLPVTGNGNGADPEGGDAEIEAIIQVPNSVTSQSRHSLLLQGSPPSGKLLIPLNRRDVRVVEGARLESVCRGNSTVGSNPTLSANPQYIDS